MNILHVSNTDRRGERFNGYSMLQQMKKVEHHIEMAVWKKESKSSSIHTLKYKNRGMFWLLHNIAWRVNNMLALEGLFCPAGFVLANQPYFRRADVVHLHLLHQDNYFSILALPTLSRRKPLVWTLHDYWPTTGTCTYSFKCNRWLRGCPGKCPYPRGNSRLKYFVPALYWQIKRMIYKHINISLVAASKWMQDRVRQSPLLNHLPCHLIPFGVDLKMFTPNFKARSRERFGIRSDEKVIAFRGIPLDKDLYKGIKWLKEALTLFEPREPTCLLIFQDGRNFQALSSKYKVIDLGWSNDDLVADALCAADLFLMPSIQEAFGLMAVESMACGTPVIVFEGTALPDVIRTPQGGLAVPAKNSPALANAIEKLLTNDELRGSQGKQARAIAEKEYGEELYIQRHLRLYETVIQQQKFKEQRKM